MTDVIINDYKINKLGCLSEANVTNSKQPDQENVCQPPSAKASYRKFKAESSLTVRSLEIPDSVIQHDLEMLQKGEKGAMDQLIKDIGGIANLSTFKLSNGKNLIEYTVDIHAPKAAFELINAGFNVNAKTIDNVSILTFLSRQTYRTSERLDWIDAAYLLVEKGADISSNNAYDCPLIEAIDCAEQERSRAEGSKYYKLLNAMLKRGANINMIVGIKEGKKWIQIRSPLYSAVLNHNAVLAKYLIDHGADKNLPIANGSRDNTPYLLAKYYATDPSVPAKIRAQYQAIYEVLK